MYAKRGEPQYHRSIDCWRRRRKIRESSLDTLAPQHARAAVGDVAGATVERLVLGDALARLTARQRAVLVLRFYEDLTEVETARLLGCSVNTVKSQSRHALGRLRALAPDLIDVFAGTTEVEAT